MTSKKPRRRQTPSLCAESHEGDGADPRAFFRVGKTGRKATRKTLQLCSQVQDALSYLLADDGNDELLELFRVAEVRPAPDASQLLVIVQPVMQLTVPVDPREVLGSLARASGRLRSGVAAAITRKRAPKLLFEVVGAPAEGGR